MRFVVMFHKSKILQEETEMKQLDPEYEKILYDNLWELYGDIGERMDETDKLLEEVDEVLEE
jgi:hypothetical protein